LFNQMRGNRIIWFNIFIQNDIDHCAYIHSVLYFDSIR
jgi:hypothetical protein